MSNKKPDTWMPIYIGDYLRDTNRLTTEQHGAYLLLIMDYWVNGPVPDDDETLAQVTKLTPSVWKKHRPKLSALFKIDGGVWHHKRIDEEREKAAKFNAKQKANGGKGGRPKKTQTETQEKPMGFDRDNPNHNPNETTPPSPSHKPIGNTNGNVDSTGDGSDEGQSAAVRFAVAVRTWEKARGKMTAMQASDPRVQAWAEAGVTDDQLRLAYDMAVDARTSEDDNTAVNAGFLDVFVAKVLKPVSGTSAISKAAASAARPWFMSSTGVDAKGKELGMEQKAGELWPYWRDRVYAAAGITDEMIRKAKIDAGEKV